MTKTENQYYEDLFKIQDENFPVQVVLSPSEDKIINVDLSKRKIEAPKFLSVVKDHKAETVYFKMNRFFEYMDLTNLTCVVQYVTKTGKSRYYPIPFYDIHTFSEEDMIIFPWVIDGEATEVAGDIQFALRFYKIDKLSHKFLYNLTTLPAKGTILYGMDKSIFNPEQYDIANEPYLAIQQDLKLIADKVRDQFYWLTIDEVEGEK